MLNFIWGGMILIGILYAAFHGTMPQVGEAALTSARDAVNLCITMLGVMGLWLGLMEVAKASGIMERLTRRLRPVLRFLFPNIPADHPSLEAIGVNLIANLLGLGWAATPAGLTAMKQLSELEKERKNPEYLAEGERRASNEMCVFLVLNISSLQLIPVNVIAYRSQYGSVNPTAVIGPGLAATLFSTVVAVVYCKLMGKKTNG